MGMSNRLRSPVLLIAIPKKDFGYRDLKGRGKKNWDLALAAYSSLPLSSLSKIYQQPIANVSELSVSWRRDDHQKVFIRRQTSALRKRRCGPIRHCWYLGPAPLVKLQTLRSISTRFKVQIFAEKIRKNSSEHPRERLDKTIVSDTS